MKKLAILTLLTLLLLTHTTLGENIEALQTEIQVNGEDFEKMLSECGQQLNIKEDEIKEIRKRYYEDRKELVKLQEKCSAYVLPKEQEGNVFTEFHPLRPIVTESWVKACLSWIFYVGFIILACRSVFIYFTLIKLNGDLAIGVGIGCLMVYGLRWLSNYLYYD